MSAVRERKLKKLRKSKIWPSVAMFITSLVVSVFVVVLFFGLYVFNFLQTKYTDSFEDADRLTASAADLREKGYDWDKIVAFLRTASSNNEIAIVDDDFNVAASHGELSYEADRTKSLNFNAMVGEMYAIRISSDYYASNHTLFPDKSMLTNSGADSESELLSFDIDLNKLAADALNSTGEDAGFDKWQREEIYSMVYWTHSPIGSTGYSLMLKYKLSILRRDVHFMLTACISAIVLLSIPMLVLLFNVINSIFQQRNLSRLLYTDEITGGKSWLYVRHHEKELISGKGLLSKLGLEREDTRTVAVVDLALQKYRSYCTCHGTEAGEQLLENIDRQINKMIYKREVCARVENAEFVLVLRGKDAEELKERVFELTQKINSGIEAHHLAWHAGLYLPNRSERDIVRLYHYAGAARASISGQENTAIALFSQEMLDRQLWEHKVEERMEDALKNEEFEVYLQPKYNPVTTELSGAEALIRWNSPTDGFISPGRFIPIFEKNGFITQIDDYMITHAAAQQAKWLSEGKPVVPVSVNVSRAHFAQPNLAEHIRSLVDRYEIPHRLIEIELTESAFFDDKASLLNTVNKLKEYGFEISMDDFGAGYSSLNSLKDLPLDVLKLDAEFFRGESELERSEVVVSEAIRLAKSLNMRIVAEGVEKKEQVDFLAGQGCDMIQGYYFAKPMPITDFEKKHWASAT